MTWCIHPVSGILGSGICSLLLLPGNTHPRKRQLIAQSRGSLPPTWETRVVCALDVHLVKIRLSGESTSIFVHIFVLSLPPSFPLSPSLLFGIRNMNITIINLQNRDNTTCWLGCRQTKSLTVTFRNAKWVHNETAYSFSKLNVELPHELPNAHLSILPRGRNYSHIKTYSLSFIHI